MEKKRKKTTKKKVAKKRTSQKKSKSEVEILANLDAREQMLVSNFVALQKVLTHLSSNIDEMTSKLDKLLNVFEISAKALAENDVSFEPSKNEGEIMEKLDTLADQNKIIARGLTMLHEKDGEESLAPKPMPPMRPMPGPKPIPPVAPMPSTNFQPSRNLQSPPQMNVPTFQTPKPLPQNTNLQSATQGYKSTTQGEEDIEQPSPPEDTSSQQ